MSYVRYDEQEVIRKLDELDPSAKTAFAAACAERQMPGYIAFSNQTGRGDPDALIAILEDIWQDVLGNKMPEDELQKNLNRCLTLIPHEDEVPWLNEQAYAEDAASAVAYALRTRSTGDSHEAAYAARTAYEALDHHTINRLGIEDNERVLEHPVVQAELERQHRDLDELLRPDVGLIELFARLRSRASAEAMIFFGPTE
jgi:uncharacterized protein YjaG (DUF416 family)